MGPVIRPETTFCASAAIGRNSTVTSCTVLPESWPLAFTTAPLPRFDAIPLT
jgi:hypothetical protein